MSSLERDGSGSEMEEREERLQLPGVPLMRTSKAVSLAAGLNRLEAGDGEGEDLPDAEEREGRISFLHSKCKLEASIVERMDRQIIFDLDAAHSHSTYNLSEAEEKKKQKRKSNRISRVIEEFINMGDVISSADKRISK